MKLALLAPAWYPVPPPRYGGIERVVSILADGLVEAGHEVTLFASRGSRTKAELAGVLPSAPAEASGDPRAMLFPIEWEEPFGLVLIESTTNPR